MSFSISRQRGVASRVYEHVALPLEIEVISYMRHVCDGMSIWTMYGWVDLDVIINSKMNILRVYNKNVIEFISQTRAYSNIWTLTEYFAI